MIKKVLVANRGEIAVRVLRACKELGIHTITVYSDADRTSLHTAFADEVYNIGKSPSTESYLKIDKIIDVAKKSNAEAIHPGYGFLAENVYFARMCEENNIIFIGPPSSAMKLLGDKIESRKTMKNVNIPIIPGTLEPVKSLDEAEKIVHEIGFPILIKASGGGGGKGMRIVQNKNELAKAMKEAQSEAMASFGNPTIYIEKYIESPRHIEFQILADNYGNIIHLGERECSIQRRHQKLIEESPSPIMTPELRKKMGDAACRAVKVSGYRNAGTVEFIVDKNRNFYFLEMNARLQVEHPVTELVTGIDIVKEQIKIASNEKLLLKQEDIKQTGAAIECRINAEDPNNNWVPSVGKIIELKEPGGPGVRIDSGIYEGFEIPVYYDPLIAKLLVWANTRTEAITRMKRALSEYRIIGIKTNIPFHIMVMNHEDFIKGNYNTHFVDKLLKEVRIEKRELSDIAAIAAVIAKETMEEKKILTKPEYKKISQWKIAGRQLGLRKL